MGSILSSIYADSQTVHERIRVGFKSNITPAEMGQIAEALLSANQEIESVHGGNNKDAFVQQVLRNLYQQFELETGYTGDVYEVNNSAPAQVIRQAVVALTENNRLDADEVAKLHSVSDDAKFASAALADLERKKTQLLAPFIS